jgi:hypothetical protein
VDVRQQASEVAGELAAKGRICLRTQFQFPIVQIELAERDCQIAQ